MVGNFTKIRLFYFTMAIDNFTTVEGNFTTPVGNITTLIYATSL
jgi:hypothetical protein